MHIHVMTPDGTAKFWLEPLVALADYHKLNRKELGRLEVIVRNDKMSSLTPGASTLAPDITGITALGFWLLVDDREFFVPFADYPDFLQATVEQIYQFEVPSPKQFYWPALDVDIDLNALEEPERFPLLFQR